MRCPPGCALLDLTSLSHQDQMAAALPYCDFIFGNESEAHAFGELKVSLGVGPSTPRTALTRVATHAGLGGGHRRDSTETGGVAQSFRHETTHCGHNAGPTPNFCRMPGLKLYTCTSGPVVMSSLASGESADFSGGALAERAFSGHERYTPACFGTMPCSQRS